MSTIFTYEIYFESKMDDDQLTLFCRLVQDATVNTKLLIWEAIGEDFVKGFVDLV